MFHSCRDVVNPSSNSKAMDILCGTTAAECTPLKLLNNFGDKSKNPMVPFQIYYEVSDDPIVMNGTLKHPIRINTTRCDGTCSCQDCRASCGAPVKPPPPSKGCSIIGVNCPTFSMATIFFTFCVIFGSYLLFNICLFLRNNDTAKRDPRVPIISKADVNCREKIGAWLERMLRNFFTNLGRWCTKKPIVTIAVGLIVCGILTSGLLLFKVTTDPVQLWSAKDSRARIEKRYFDENFS